MPSRSQTRRASNASSTVQQPAGSGAQRPRRPGQRHVHAGDVVPGVDRQRGGHRGVDPAAHRGEHPHPRSIIAAAPRPAPPAGTAATTGPMASATAVDVVGGRGVPEGEPQGRPRSVLSAGPSPAARATGGPPRRCRPTRSSIRCRRRPAASAASRPRSRGSAGGRCRAAGTVRRPPGLRRGRRRARRPGPGREPRRSARRAGRPGSPPARPDGSTASWTATARPTMPAHVQRARTGCRAPGHRRTGAARPACPAAAAGRRRRSDRRSCGR